MRGLPSSVEGFRGAKATYGQFGEDAVLAWLFDATELSGLYLDLGCHHPIRWSNTYHFYLRGWRGVTVDASPRYRGDWRLHRPRDRHLVAAITPVPSYGDVLFDEGGRHPATGRVIRAEHAGTSDGASAPEGILSIESLGEWWEHSRAPDLVSMDLEGMDREVVLHYPFSELAPRVFVAELGDQEASGRAAECLSKHGYRLTARIGPSWVWVRGRR